MKQAAPSCPDDQQLAAFLDEKLGPDAGAAVADHVAACAACQAALRLLSPSSQLVRLLSPGAGGASLADAAGSGAAGAARFAGDRLGPYHLVARLGSGGMGEVYAARDERLGRMVAIKLLRPELASDPSLRVRFQREARAAARLSHPNIVVVHAVEQDGEVPFLVMEHVDGQALAARIQVGGMDARPLLELALPLADAVAEAHDHGLVHRDLKPQNVMISDAGRLKVLDFGLARPAATTGPRSATSLTFEGAMVGTLAYMSPEQAEGREVDARSDVFSLGVMLFELATGERPSVGESPAALLAAILRDRPRPMSALRAGHPPRLEAIVDRCLRKSPAERYPSARELHGELVALRRELERAAPMTAPARWARLVPLAAALGVLGLAGLVARRGSKEAVPAVAALPRGPTLGPLRRLTFSEGRSGHPSWSPDGTWFVHDTCPQGPLYCLLYRRGLDGEVVELSSGSEPAVSPDGATMIVHAENRAGAPGLILVPLGEARAPGERLGDLGHDPAWLPDGSGIVFQDEAIDHPEDRLLLARSYRMPLATRTRVPLLAADAAQLQVSPHGLRVAFFRNRLQGGTRAIMTAPLEGGPALALTDEPAVDFRPHWSPDGRFIYFLRGQGAAAGLWRIPVDEASGRAGGPAERLWQAVREGPSEMAISRDGKRLLLAMRSAETQLVRAPFDAERERVTGELQEVAAQVTSFSLGAERLVFSRNGAHEDLWLARPDGSDPRRITTGPALHRMPRLSPDGKSLAFLQSAATSWRVWLAASDGGAARALETGEDGYQLLAWSPDGGKLITSTIGFPTWFDVSTTGAPRRWQGAPKGEAGTAYLASDCSPDGGTLLGVKIGPDGAASGTWTQELASGEFRQVATVGQSGPRFFQRGQRVVLADDHRVLASRLDGSRLHELVRVSPDRAREPAISPDGKWLYFIRERIAGDIWLADLRDP